MKGSCSFTVTGLFQDEPGDPTQLLCLLLHRENRYRCSKGPYGSVSVSNNPSQNMRTDEGVIETRFYSNVCGSTGLAVTNANTSVMYGV